MASSCSKTTHNALAIALALSACQSAPTLPTPRRATTVTEFKRLNPCPATGQPAGPCPGWIADHIIPLCAGGADDPGNMQWQDVADALEKDRAERATCRALRNAVR